MRRKTFAVSMAVRESKLRSPWDPKYTPRKDVGRINAERLAVIRQLNGMGYRVAVPRYEIAHDEKLFSRLPKGVRVFRANPPIAGKTISLGQEAEEMHESARWTRDLWQKMPAGRRVKRFSREGENSFGEGSLSLFLPNKVVIANKRLRGNATVEELRGQGFRFYFVAPVTQFEPHPVSPKLPGRKNVITHVDFFAGAVGNVLLVDRGFYFRNWISMRRAAKLAGLKVLFVPASERRLYPANFLVLEENKAMVDRDAKETIALLREHGVEVVPTRISLRGNRKAKGGVHCFVNEL